MRAATSQTRLPRGRDYYTPYRTLVPRGSTSFWPPAGTITQHAQKMSRDILPCMAMGETAGVAASVALSWGTIVARVDVRNEQRRLRADGIQATCRTARCWSRRSRHGQGTLAALRYLEEVARAARTAN